MDKYVKSLSVHGLLLGIIIICTVFIRIPVPTFKLYFNLGEAVIYLTALLYGKTSAALIGGIGSALADIIGGYPIWAPISLLIKGLEGYVVGLAAERFSSVVSIALGAFIMIIGYATAAGIIFGIGAVPIELVGDIVQVTTGAILGLILYKHLKNILK